MEIAETEGGIAEAAVDTLKPGGAPGETKAVMLDTFVQLLAQLGRDDLTNLFDQVQAQYGPNGAPGAVDNADANRATVAAKPSAATAMKEDLDEMFSGEELSEELKEKASVIFEAAVGVRVNLEMARLAEEFETLEAELTEQYETKLQESVIAATEDMTEKLDQYLDYAIENWMTENKVAIETSLRADIAENFIQGLHNLFAEHYITVPDEKIDLVAEMKAELDETKAQLEEAVDARIQLESAIDEANRELAFEAVSEGLAATQVEKLRTLSEGLEYSDAETFARKLTIVKENYFGGTKAAPSTGLIVESIDGDDGIVEDKTVSVSPEMDRYVKAISSSKK